MKATKSFKCEGCKYPCVIYVYFDTRNREEVTTPVKCVEDGSEAYWKPERGR